MALIHAYFHTSWRSNVVNKQLKTARHFWGERASSRKKTAKIRIMDSDQKFLTKIPFRSGISGAFSMCNDVNMPANRSIRKNFSVMFNRVSTRVAESDPES